MPMYFVGSIKPQGYPIYLFFLPLLPANAFNNHIQTNVSNKDYLLWTALPRLFLVFILMDTPQSFSDTRNKSVSCAL